MMRTPPLLLAAGLLFWGWRCDHWLVAAVLALTLEPWRWIRWRWAIADTDFFRASDFSSVALAIVAIYQFNDHGLHGIFGILQWTPVILWPLTALQLYSTRGLIPLTALFISVRRQARADPGWPVGSIDLSYPYFLSCLLASSTGELHGPGFFLPLCLLLGWGLWPWRPRCHPAGLWLGMWLAACVLGFGLQFGMVGVQGYMEDLVLRWMENHTWSDPNPDRAMTAIGSIGRLKLSDAIRVWVKTGAPLTHPLLLKEASYDSYHYGVWKTANPGFAEIEARPAIRTWALRAGAPSDTLRVGIYLHKETGLAPVPAGLKQVGGSHVLDVETNRYGSVQIESKPGYLDYTVGYDAAGRAGTWPAAAPDDADLAVPAAYQRDLAGIAARLKLSEKTPVQRLTAVHAFFRDNFRYAMVQPGHFPWVRPLSDFLLRRRAGHCEYFATATVLLLREAGIPARYAVGYAVSEYSHLQHQYIARGRDAHAWAEAYVDGKWRTVDNTPSVWLAEDDSRTPFWQPLSDFATWVSYTFAHWRNDERADHTVLLWAIVPLSAILIWRLRRRKRVRVATTGGGAAAARDLQGADSELLILLDRIKGTEFEPRAGETLTDWGRRVLGARVAAGDLQGLFSLHYRYRFDPRGLSPAQRQALRKGASQLSDELMKKRHKTAA